MIIADRIRKPDYTATTTASNVSDNASAPTFSGINNITIKLLLQPRPLVTIASTIDKTDTATTSATSVLSTITVGISATPNTTTVTTNAVITNATAPNIDASSLLLSVVIQLLVL